MRTKPITDLGRQLGQLILREVQHQRAGLNQHPTVFQHRLDPGHQPVIGLKRLHWAERRLSKQRSRGCHRIDGVGLCQTPRSTLLRGALRWHFTSIEARRCDAQRRHATPSSLSPRHRLAQRLGCSATRSLRRSRCCCCRTCRGSISTPFASITATVNVSWCGSIPATVDDIMEASCWLLGRCR